MKNNTLEQLIEVFDSYKSAYGLVTDLKEDRSGKVQGNYRLIRKELSDKQFKNHLEGKGVGLRLIPLKENQKLRYAALDLDKKCPSSPLRHTIFEIEKKIKELGIPLIPCQSKSGDIHLYCFASEDIDADLFMEKMNEWASLLGYGGCEKFPKQTSRADQNDTGMPLNLPYYDAENTNRFSVNKGKQLSLEEFIEYAKVSQVTEDELINFQYENLDQSYNDGPPCLQMMATKGVDEGGRSHGLFSFAVYLNKKYPDNFEEKIHEANSKYFSPKLSYIEVTNIIKSVSKKEYSYKCKEDPCAMYCNKKECMKRKFGVGELSVGSDILIENLTQYVTPHSESVRWYAECLGHRIQLTTEELMSQAAVRTKIASKTKRLMSPMKQNKWFQIIDKLMSNAMTLEDPEDASKEGQFKEIIYNWFAKVTPLPEDKRVLNSLGYYLDKEENRIVFKSQELFTYLKQQRFFYVEQDIWHTLRERFNAKSTRVDMGGIRIRVWSIPAFEFYDHSIEDEGKL